MSGTRASSMDVNLDLASRGAPRVSSAEARRLQEERLKSFNADNGNSLYPRLWDRAGQQQQQPTQQYNGGQSSGRSNAS
ncbi:hypothetical protein VSDG_03516 [Cytospora chrysosperma]|uniref:Uncharacterized protein n=1 Tax=Cytospora chrysosperma TaxID=252740 RepID=A0A423W9S7_CYTCH|nr:hypothetical protein VSDG_03516 [Valsa sordida]